MKKNAKKKTMKIVLTEQAKEQIKKMPKKVKKEFDMFLKALRKNQKPEDMPGSMSVFGEPSAKELMQWMHNHKSETVALVLEYLLDKECLNNKGKNLADDFWKKEILKEDKKQ